MCGGTVDNKDDTGVIDDESNDTDKRSADTGCVIYGVENNIGDDARVNDTDDRNEDDNGDDTMGKYGVDVGDSGDIDTTNDSEIIVDIDGNVVEVDDPGDTDDVGNSGDDADKDDSDDIVNIDDIGDPDPAVELIIELGTRGVC